MIIDLRMDAGADNWKKLGYVLFAIGIILIAYVIGSIVYVFVGAGNVPLEIFEVKNDEKITLSLPDYQGNVSNMTMENTMEDMYPMFNLMIWLSIAFLLLFAGYFLCKLGLTAMKSPETSKPNLKKSFGGKKHRTHYKEKVETADYSQINNEDFEERHYGPV